MAGASEDGGGADDTISYTSVESRKRGLSGSVSVRTRKLGRRLSRSVSIVALKLPEKAQNITRSSSRLIRTGSREKKSRCFELSIILPDKTQTQVTAWAHMTVAEVAGEPLRRAGAVLAGVPPAQPPASASHSALLSLPPVLDALNTPHPPHATLLFLGGSKAPVDPRALAATLEGEILVAERQPPHWDGRDLETFIAWEKFYASTLFSAVELYGKPLLRSAVITKEEYHLLFHFLESVSEASEALTQRMRKYIDSGLLVREIKVRDDDDKVIRMSKQPEEDTKSLLSMLVQEGVISQRDIDVSSEHTNKIKDSKTDRIISENDHNNRSSSSLSFHRIHEDMVNDCNESIIENSIMDIYDKKNGLQYSDNKISSDITDNVWANVKWEFLNPADYGYDQVRSVKRSSSDSAITPVLRRRRDFIYDTLRDGEGESCDSVTPYESIEDLYDCIKNVQYNSAITEDSSPSTINQSEPQYPDYYEKNRTNRQSSTSSEKSGVSSTFPYSKCSSSDSASAFISCESTSAIGNLVGKSLPESLKRRELPEPPSNGAGDASESAILLKQLFTGELMDAYGEFLAAYPLARALLRRKMRHDEHFAALADIRRGAAKYTIAEYLELPIERLAQYERVSGSGCGRRRAARLSDLERVQDLFPHDQLALHDADAPALLAAHHAQKSKSLRKRPSLDLGGSGAANSGALSPRTFIMEAPVHLCPLGTSSPPLDRHLFLFNDLLLVGKSRGTNCFKLKESVRLAEVWISLSEGDDTSFLIGWPTFTGVSNYMATYPTQAARDTWYRKIQSAVNTLLSTEPKSTNIQLFYKDQTNPIEFCKTVSVGPEMSARSVVQQCLHVLRGGGDIEDGGGSGEGGPDRESSEGRWGAAGEFVLAVRGARDAPPTALQGIERPHAIQMSRIRQTLSNEDGFDLQHVNAKNNPCGLVFELRKKNQVLKNGHGTPGRALRLLRRGAVGAGPGAGGGRLFGVPLHRLCGGAPPPALLAALRRLRVLAPLTRGVFRRNANAKALRMLRDKLDALGPWVESCPELERASVLLLAPLVKEFFRALPQPLLVADLYPGWLHVLNQPQSEKICAAKALLQKLPHAHYIMLTYFVCLLQAIAKKSNINLMCPTNLGVCVGPSLLWPNTPCEKAPKTVPMVVELLIVNADALFGPQISSLLGSGSPESSNALLDSGAEESDSLHSVGISLDSMDLSSPRKEKLSLSRDSGLTLSEDDSNSNGGNSPAPRNILHSLSAPTCNLQQDTKVVLRYGNENHNLNSQAPINHRQSMYSNRTEMFSTVNEDLYTTPFLSERYAANIGFTNGIDDGTYGPKTAVQRPTAEIYGQSPAKYITGFEPQKPPRSNVSKAARTSKVYSMYADIQPAETKTISKKFNRAKSSDNLLEVKQESIDSKRDLISSQEDILYSNIKDLAMFTENIQRQNQFQANETNNYSRVYSGWEKNSSHNPNTNGCSRESVYSPTGKQVESSANKTEGKVTPAATIFARNDWTRQAARTKSLEMQDEVANTERPRSQDLSSACCRRRRHDPAHVCNKSCTTPREQDSRAHQNPYLYVDNINNNDELKKVRIRNYNNKLNQCNSLANIMVQSDSSSSDTLYQPPGSYPSRSPSSSASDTPADPGYTTQYIEPLYNSVYNRRRDIFHEDQSIFGNDIYKATPTAVQPDYRGSDKEQKKQKCSLMPPPVPPRKMVYQRVLKKFPPVHVNKEDKGSRSKSVPPLYRDPPAAADNNQNVIALGCSDTDTESESYV